MSPNPKRRTEVIAHRGLHARARENTVEAFQLAIAAGADAIELDVHASADGTVVVHHDPTVGQEALPIASNDLKKVQTVARKAGFELPTLQEVLETIGGTTKVYIEVKAPDIELLVARAVRTSSQPLAIHSFDHRIVKKIRDFAPGIQTGVLTVSRPVNPVRLLTDASASDYWPQRDFVDLDLVTGIHDAGGRVIVWTANLPEEWERLVSLKVDGICTDRPELLRSWLNSA